MKPSSSGHQFLWKSWHVPSFTFPVREELRFLGSRIGITSQLDKDFSLSIRWRKSFSVVKPSTLRKSDPEFLNMKTVLSLERDVSIDVKVTIDLVPKVAFIVSFQVLSHLLVDFKERKSYPGPVFTVCHLELLPILLAHIPTLWKSAEGFLLHVYLH